MKTCIYTPIHMYLLLITYNTLFQRPCNTLDTGIYLKTKIKDKRAYTPLYSFLIILSHLTHPSIFYVHHIPLKLRLKCLKCHKAFLKGNENLLFCILCKNHFLDTFVSTLLGHFHHLLHIS